MSFSREIGGGKAIPTHFKVSGAAFLFLYRDLLPDETSVTKKDNKRWSFDLLILYTKYTISTTSGENHGLTAEGHIKTIAFYHSSVLFVLFNMCVLAGLPVSAYGWEHRIGDVDFSLTAQEIEAYDDNVYYSKDNNKEELRNDTTLGVIAAYEGKVRQISLSGSLSRHTYSSSSSLNNTSGIASITLIQEVSEYGRIKLRERVVRAYEPQTFSEEFGNIDGRYGYTRNNFNLEFTREYTKSLSSTFRYENEAFMASFPGVSDSYLNKASVELDYAITPRTLFLVGLYEYLHRSYEDSVTVITHRPSAGIRHFITPKSELFFRVGADISKQSSNTQQGQFLEASFNEAIDEKSLISLSYSKENIPSSYSADIFDSQKISLSAERKLFKRLSGAVAAFYGEGSYASSDISENFSGMSISGIYEIRKNVKATLSYSHSRKNSSSDLRDYTRNYLMAGIKIEF